MPEGHTIHRLARTLLRDLRGDALRASSPQGRAVELAAAIDDTRLEQTDAHGKHLLARFSSGDTVHVHLGLYGRVGRRRSPALEPRGLIRLRLEGERWTEDLSGPTACERLDPAQEAALLARLGPDPLRADADPERFAANLARRRIGIGAALLDQSVIAGVGNVYRAEALHALGMDPRRPARDLRAEEVDLLWATVARMLSDGVREGRIRTVERVPGRRLRRGEAVHVYRQSACRACGGPVERFEQAARTMYACAACQPPERMGA